MSQRFLKGVPRVSYECLRVFKGCISSVLHVYFIIFIVFRPMILKVSQGCLKFSAKYQRNFTKITWVSEGFSNV